MPFSGYAGSYGMDVKKRLESIKIPDKIVCRECKKVRTSHVSFSEKQLLDYKTAVAARNGSFQITCRQCTPQQKTEMRCSQCQKVKGLDGFTKAQRRTPDDARCMECVYKNQTAAPMNPTSDKLFGQLCEDDDSSDESDDQTNPYEQSDNGASNSGVPIYGSSTTHQLNQENLKVASSAASNVSAWKQHAASAWKQTTASAVTSGIEYNAYDAKGCAHVKIHNQSVADTDESYATSRVSRKTERDVKNTTSKFARGLGPRQEPRAPAEYVGGRVAEVDSDDDSDCSYGYI